MRLLLCPSTRAYRGLLDFAFGSPCLVDRRAHRGEFEHLVIVADRQTLGQLRPSLHKEVQQRLVREVTKALTNSSIEDIETAIS